MGTTVVDSWSMSSSKKKEEEEREEEEEDALNVAVSSTDAVVSTVFSVSEVQHDSIMKQ